MSSLEILSTDLLAWRKRQLEKGGRLVDLDWLLDIEGGLSWSELQLLIIEPSRKVFLEQPFNELERIWLKHLDDHTPLQYLTGRCPWRDFELEVNPDVLIPRQETELLIDLALDRANSSDVGSWVDLGTGSGAIAVALGRALPRWHGFAVDKSSEALLIARRNIEHLAPKAQMDFAIGNWWKPLRPFWGSLDLVLCNPPYIPSELIDKLDQTVKSHEPHLALCGGMDGLIECRKVLAGAFKALAPLGWLLMEHHHDQSDEIMELMRKEGLEEISFETDLQGVRRFAICRRP